MSLKSWKDEELIEELRELDGRDGTRMSDWEVKFLESVFRQDLKERPLSGKQREKCIELIEAYR